MFPFKISVKLHEAKKFFTIFTFLLLVRLLLGGSSWVFSRSSFRFAFHDLKPARKAPRSFAFFSPKRPLTSSIEAVADIAWRTNTNLRFKRTIWCFTNEFLHNWKLLYLSNFARFGGDHGTATAFLDRRKVESMITFNKYVFFLFVFWTEKLIAVAFAIEFKHNKKGTLLYLLEYLGYTDLGSHLFCGVARVHAGILKLASFSFLGLAWFKTVGSHLNPNKNIYVII